MEPNRVENKNVFDRDHVNYFPKLIYTFVRSVIASMNQYNMFQSISLWCAMQSLSQKHVVPVCKTFRYVSVIVTCKKTCIKSCGLFWTNCDLTRSKHELLYMHCCFHRIMLMGSGIQCWFEFFYWNFSLQYCIIIRLNFFFWYMYYENITKKNK